jgi:hypothetical protein
LEGRQIPRQALADRLVVTAQPIGKPAATTLEQLLVQRRKARRPRHRHQQVPANPADQPFHFAFVIPLTRTAEPFGKQIIGGALMRSVLPALAIVLAQASQPGAGSKSQKWCFEREQQGAQRCEATEDACNQLRELNTEIAKSPCKRVEPPEMQVSPTESPAPPSPDKQTPT